MPAAPRTEMKTATFYLLPTTTQSDADVQLALACRLATERYRLGQSLFVCVADQEQGWRLDEMLWQQEADSFVPHSLSDEPTAHQAPVEIGTGLPRRNRQLLINLSPQAPAFAGRFAEVVDFVPTDDSLKQLARERYKQYRAAGFTLQTQAAPSAAEAQAIDRPETD